MECEVVMFLVGLTVGIFVGSFVTIATFALCSTAKGDIDDDE